MLALVFLGACSLFDPDDLPPQSMAPTATPNNDTSLVEELVELLISVRRRPTPTITGTPTATASATRTPTLTATPTLTPTLTLTPTIRVLRASPTLLPSPTIDPQSTSDSPVVLPSLTPTPFPTPLPTEAPGGGGGSGSDTPKPNLVFSQPTYTVNETATLAVITVRLIDSGGVPFPIGQTVTVQFKTRANSALANIDYNVVPPTVLTFPPYVSSITTTIEILNDSLDEDTEALYIDLLNNSSNVDLLAANDETTLKILDDDPLPSVWFTSSSYNVDENLGPAIVTLQLNTPSGRDVTVSYSTADGLAQVGPPYQDYTAPGPTIFPVNSVTGRTQNITQTLALNINDDLRDEFDEDFNLSIFALTNATPAVPSSATLLIIDNDPLPQVSIDSPFTIEASGLITSTVSVLQASEKPITVTYITKNIDALAGSDYITRAGVFTFPPFPTTGHLSQTLDIPIIDDIIDEGNETFQVHLGSPINATIGTSPGINTILDDDLPPVITLTNASVVEGDVGSTTMLFTAMLSMASQKLITVPYTTVNSTTTNSDYTPVSNTLIFPVGTTVQTFTVFITGDYLDEYPQEQFFIQMTSPDPTRILIGSGGIGTIIDDDRADIELTKSDNPNPVVAGEVLTYTLTITNLGPTKASNVIITDTWPTGDVSFNAAASSPDCSPISSNIVCAVGPLTNVNDTRTFTLVGTVNPLQRGFISNQATVSINEPDPNTTNNTTPAILTTVDGQADLTLTKSSTPNPISAGLSLTYTIVVSNNGPSTAINAIITDTLPAAVSYNAAASKPTCNEVSSIVSCLPTSITPGSRLTTTLVVTVPSSFMGTLINSARVTSNDTDPAPGNEIFTQTTIVNDLVDLELSKIDTPDPVVAGTNLTYTLSLTNYGPSDANTVTITDTLPSSLTFVSVSSGACNHSGGSPGGIVTCSMAILTPGTNNTFTIVGTTAASARGLINNQATAGTSASEADSNVANNTVTIPTTVQGNADLVITKNDTPDPVIAGQALTYTINVANNGPSDALNLVLTDTLPPGIVLNTATPSQGTCTGLTVVSCTTPSLTMGNSLTVTLVTTVAAPTRGLKTNTVSVTSADIDPNPGQESTTITTMVNAQADLVLTKLDSTDPVIAGTSFTYTLIITNNGPSDATNLLITDTLPAGIGVTAITPATPATCGQSGRVITCLPITLAPNTNFVTTIAVTTSPALIGVISNTATIQATEPDPNPGQESTTITTTINTQADLVLTKLDSSDPVTAGTSFTYTLIITNNGPSNATNLLITDTLPTSVNVTSITPATCGQSGGMITCPPITLTPQANFVATIAVTTPFTAAGIISNTAIAQATEPDPTPANHTEPTTLILEADLVISKSDNPDPVIAGTPLTYTIIVTNNGPSFATNLLITDTLPASVTVGVPTTSQGGCVVAPGNLVICTPGTLGLNNTVTLTIPVTTTTGLSGSLVNTATTTSNGIDTSPANATTTEPTTVNQQADLSLSKSSSLTSVIAGDLLTYTLTVLNNGPSDAGTVVVSDTLPANITINSIVPATNTQTGQTLNWNFVTIAGGAIQTITIQGTVNNNFSGTLTNTATVSSVTPDPGPDLNTDFITTTATTQADLSLTKTVDNTNPRVNQPITFTITALNNGPSNATNVAVLDKLPAGLDYGSATAGPGTTYNSASGLWQIGPLTNSTTVTLTVVATVSSVSPVTNTAQITVATPPDPNSPHGNNVESDDDQKSVQITPQVIAPVTAAISHTNMITGPSTITYTFTTDVLPITSTLPFTYIWEATSQTLTTHTNIWAISDTITYIWSLSGTKTITVTVSNVAGTQVDTHTLAFTDTIIGFKLGLPFSNNGPPGSIYLPIIVKN